MPETKVVLKMITVGGKTMVEHLEIINNYYIYRIVRLSKKGTFPLLFDGGVAFFQFKLRL